MSPFRFRGRLPARALFVSAVLLAAAFLTVGFVGVDRYGRNYWLYRGFPPPSDPGYVKQKGTEQRISVTSPALGGRNQEVFVYLPPGYSQHPQRRYPVVYLLHGFPGRPLAFLLTVRLGVVEDELYAKDKGQPVILVMPFGSTGTFTDKEWVDGVGQGEDWATFVSHDLVQAIDARYRTIPTPAARARVLLVLLRRRRSVARAEPGVRERAEAAAHSAPLPRVPRRSQLGALARTGAAGAAHAGDEAPCLGCSASRRRRSSRSRS